MAIQFPDSPKEGDQFTASNGVIYTYENGAWNGNSASGLEDVFVNISGDEMSGNLTVPSLNGGPLGGFRNQLINGDFRIWQRGTGPTEPTSDNKFLADRWITRVSSYTQGDPTVELFQDGNISKHRYTAVNLKEVSYLRQEIEASNIRPYAGTQMTLSFYASFTPYITVGVYDSTDSSTNIKIDGAENLPFIKKGDRYTCTFDVPTGQIASSAIGAGMKVTIYYADATVPADGTYDTWNVQLEPGPAATPFENRPIGTELALCQRYCVKMTYLGISGPDGAKVQGTVSLPVPMRAAPTYPALGISGGADIELDVRYVPRSGEIGMYGTAGAILGSSFGANGLRVSNTIFNAEL